MAEAAQGGGDPVLMIRGVLDMTQPYQELQNLGRAASEGTTFSNSGTPGTSGSSAARERASRAIERQGDQQDAQQTSFNSTYELAARMRRSNRQVEGAEIRANAFGWANERNARDAAYAEAASAGMSFDMSSGDYGDDPLSAGGGGFSRRRGRALGRQAQARRRNLSQPHGPGYGPYAQAYENLAEERAEREAFFENAASQSIAFDFPSGGYGNDPLSATQGGSSRRRARTLNRQAQLRQDRLPMYGPGDGPDADYNRQRAETLAEQNAGVNEPHGPGFGPTEETNRLFAGERATNATWARRNLPTLFGRGNNGQMSVFYRRFLLMEAIRGASNATMALANEPAALASAGSDQMAVANAQFQTTQHLAESIPFAGGLIFGAANMISGAGTDMARAGASINVANSLMATRQQSGDQRYALLQQSRIMSAPRGFARESQRITEEQDSKNREARSREAEAGEASGREARDARADLLARDTQSRTRRAFVNAALGLVGLQIAESGVDVEGEENAIQGNALRQRNLAGQRRQEDEQRNKTIADTHQRELVEDLALTRTSGVASGGVALSQAQRQLVLIGSAIGDPRAQAAVAIQAVQNANQAQTTEEDNQLREAFTKGGQASVDAIAPGINLQRQTRNVQVRNQTLQIQAQADRSMTQMRIGISGTHGVLSARLAHDPEAEATARYRQGQEEASLLPADMQSRARENVEMQRRLEGEDIQRQTIGFRMQSGNLQARLNRDPYQAIQSTFQGQMDLAKISPFGKQQEEHARLQQQVSMQEIRDRQVALGGRQALSLAVSGMLATAVGPGAADTRRRASIMETAGSAELTAQSLMRDESLGNQQERINFANNARQEGINNLAAQRAQYVQGLHFRARSLFEIAPGNKEGSNPSNVLQSFENGIRSLKGNMNSTDFTGEKGSTNNSVPGLLQRLIQVVQGGVPARAA